MRWLCSGYSDGPGLFRVNTGRLQHEGGEQPEGIGSSGEVGRVDSNSFDLTASPVRLLDKGVLATTCWLVETLWIVENDTAETYLQPFHIV